MSKFNTVSAAGKSAALTNELNNVVAQLQGEAISSEQAGALLGIEGFATSEENLQHNYDVVLKALADAGLRDELIQHLTADGGMSEEDAAARAEVGLEAAAITAMALGNPVEAQRAILHASHAPDKTVPVDNFVPGIATAMPDMQAFHEQSFDKWRSETIRMAALNALNSEFIEAFFKTRVMEPSENGQIVEVKVPYAYTRKRRAANGAADGGVEKISLLRAAEDPHLLEDFSTDIMPRGDVDADNDSFLVDKAVIPNVTRTIHGESIETRPLVFGKTINLIGVSNHPGLLGSGSQTDADTIEPYINLGDLYVTASLSVGGTPTTYKFKVDVSGLTGSLFTQQAEGSTSGMSLAFNNTIAINSTMLTLAGTNDHAAELASKLGIAAGTKFTIGLNTKLNGTANHENADIEVFKNGFELGEVYVEGSEEPLTGAGYDALKADVTFDLVGFYPRSRRTNVTLRQDGYLIDEGTTTRFYYGMQIGAPVSSTRPVSQPGGAASLDVLRRALRVVSNGNAFKCLFTSEQRIRQMFSTGVLPANASTIGGLYVKPYFYEDSINLKDDIAIITSGKGYDDARGLLIDTVTAGIDEVALESGYLTALENFDGAAKSYEVVIGTDPRIGGLLMRSGDGRTFGEGRNFKIVTTTHKEMRNKIYFTFRRPIQDGVDALSFGAHLYKAPLVHEVNNQAHNNGTIAKVQAQPVELYTNTLPIMGVIHVDGVTEYFKRA